MNVKKIYRDIYNRQIYIVEWKNEKETSLDQSINQ